MADRRQIGVRYCGGCNPRYDRVALVKRIGGFFPEAEFVTAQAGVKYPAVLVVCGCPSRCANVSDLAVPAGRLIYLSGWEELLPVKEKLAEALKPVINAVLSTLKKLWKVSAKAIGVPPKWLHLAAHAKKARTRKKYRNRIRRYVFEALAAEGGGGP